MTREEVFGVVKRHFQEIVEGSGDGAFDGAKSMKDYGATSLDMVEVVSVSMRELKIKISRAELNQVTNIDGLVDVLFRGKQQGL